MERTISVVTDVKDINDLLKGARLDEAKLVPAGRGMQLVLGFTRAMIEQRRVVRRGLFHRLKTPWTKCQLSLKGIALVAVKRLEDLAADEVPLLSCEAVKGGYQLAVQAQDGLQFVLEVPQLEGTFADVGSPIETP